MVEEQPGIFDQEDQIYEEEGRRRQAEYTRGRRNMETLRVSEKPEAIRWAIGNVNKSEEGRDTFEAPNRFTRSSVMEIIEDRQDELRLRLNQDLLRAWDLQEQIYGSTITRPDPKTRLKQLGEEALKESELKSLIEELRESGDLFWSRWGVLEAYRLHRTLGLDLDMTTVKRITSPGHAYPETGWFKTIGIAKETLPNGERLGTMVDQALRLWCDIGEGKLGEDKNIFYGSRSEPEYESAINYVALGILEKARNEGKNIPEIPESEREYSLYWQDALAAAMVAEEIFRLFDLDVTFDRGEKKDIDPGDWEEWSKSLMGFISHAPGSSDDGAIEWRFEGGKNSSDLGKICHFILRQLNEFGRDHPRAVVAPAVVGCYPNLTINFMEMTTVEVEQVNQETGKKETIQHFNLWQLWRDGEIAFGDLPWGEKTWEGGVQRLKEAGLLVLDEGVNEEDLEVKGVSQDAYDIPYTLQHFYAVGTVWAAITRKDWDKAFADVRNPNYLAGINKGFESTFLMMENGTGLWKLKKEKKTMAKLRQLQKMNFLIGVLVANLPDPNPNERDDAAKVTSQGQITKTMEIRMNREKDRLMDFNHLADEVLDAAIASGFLSSSNTKDKEQLEREKMLLRRAIGEYGAKAEWGKALGIKGVGTRRGFLPSESGWFGPEELEAIRDSGLFEFGEDKEEGEYYYNKF